MSVNKKPLQTVPSDAPTTVKSKGFIHNATDTFHELALIFLGTVILGGLLYALFEGKGLLDGVWWAFVTAFTVGYGDVVPTTLAGRIVAGALMTISVFIIVPLITARMASKMIVNDDAWTDREQEYVKSSLTRMNAYLDAQDTQKQAAPTKRTPRSASVAKASAKNRAVPKG